jgi:hypothetical protein
VEFSEMYGEVAEHLASRGDVTTAQIKTRINRVYRRLAKSFSFHELEETDESLTTVDGTASCTVPAGVWGIQSIKIDDTDNETNLVPRDMVWYERQDTRLTKTTGRPRYYILWKNLIYLWITPDDAYSLRVRHKIYPTALSGDSDVPVYPEEWHEYIVLQTAAEFALLKNMSERYKELKNEALGIISTIQEDDTIESRSRTGQVAIQRTRTKQATDVDYAEIS